MNGGFDFRPAMELITHISHIKTLEAHHGIGYGHTYVTDKDMRIATIPVGYADGYPRALSNKGHVLIRGKRCPILGRVCMDQMMVDVTDIPEAKIEDKVTLVGRDGGEFISAEEVADASYSFNYEFVCGIARRVPRIYVQDGKVNGIMNYLNI
jgi:alanine racemase